MKNLMLLSLLTVAAIFSAASAFAAVSQPVDLKEGGKTYHGTLFLPDNGPEKAGERALPLVVVVHEWWGKTEYPEMRARKIADELGYAALAVDLYGDSKTATTPNDAQALAMPFYKDPEMGVKLLDQFVAAAPEAAKRGHAALDSSKIAAIGYCFGGSQALNLARAGALPSGDKLLGVVSFHGGLASSLKATSPIHAKLLVLHGAADKMVTPKDVAAFKAEMKKAHANLSFHAYPGALHAFTNPQASEIGKKYGIPIAYDAKADQDSWARMKAFLAKLFK